MKNNQNPVLKLIIFLFGIVIITVASALLKNLFPERTAEYIFACVSAALIYTAAFLPIALTDFSAKMAKLAASGVIYYKGMAAYAVISAADMVLALRFLPIGYAVLIQCIALFVFLIYIYLACFTAGHISNVETAEKAKLSAVTELRSKAQKLVTAASVLDERNKDMKEAAAKIAENMRYLSPNSSQEACELEGRMSGLLDSMLMDKFFVSGGSYSRESFEAKLRDFDVLYRQRKNIV